MASDEGMRARSADSSNKKLFGHKQLSEVSVIVPTYNEVENIRPLCERLFKATKDAGLTAELIFVDDESSGSADTEKIVAELKKEKYTVRIHCRKKTEGRGLSSAVLIGFGLAEHPVILCMDADLQHEPESVPAVARPVLDGEAEFSVGSRNVQGGGVGFEWSGFRRGVSHGATLLAWGVSGSSDPMSGFFATTKEVLKRGEGRLNPIGFKIGLEIMSRCRADPVADVAITFRERIHGESKLSAKQYYYYIRHLGSLYFDRHAPALLVCFVMLMTLLYVMYLQIAARL